MISRITQKTTQRFSEIEELIRTEEDHPRSRGLYVFFTVQIDESGTDSQHDTVIVAGAIGRDYQWEDWNDRIQKLGKAAGLHRLHAKEIRHQLIRNGIGQHYREVFNDIYRYFNDLEFGLVVILRKKDFDTYFKMKSFPRGERRESQYGLCFNVAVFQAVQILWQLYGEDINKISFVVEREPSHSQESEDIYFRFINSDLPEEIRPYISRSLRIHDNSDKQSPGLFASDVVARRVLGWERARETKTTRKKISKSRGEKQRLYVFRLGPRQLRSIRKMKVTRSKQRRAHWNSSPRHDKPIDGET